MDPQIKNKRGQVTLFIIMAVVIVAAVITIIFLNNKEVADVPTSVGPQQFIRNCLEEAIEEAIGGVLSGGGRISPTHTLFYYGEEYNYLCYQEDFYKTCYNTHPVLKKIVEKELLEEIRFDVQSCFDIVREDYEDENYQISGGATNYSIELLPGIVRISLRKKISISKGGTSQEFNNFDMEIPSPLYNLVEIAHNIVNGESQFCNFEYNGYMLIYPQYDIRRIGFNTNKVYRLIDRGTEQEFRFAVRSCAFPPGI